MFPSHIQFDASPFGRRREQPEGDHEVLDQAEDEQITFVIMCALNLVLLDHGAGVHRWNIRVKDILANLPV